MSMPRYDPTTDGPAFEWIMKAADQVRRERRVNRLNYEQRLRKEIDARALRLRKGDYR